jgi:predicted metal-dependent hydrolase
MEPAVIDYDPRYLGGILFFNDRDFFEAHEVWESLWLECAGPERRFYQGLIQAAVALYHFGNGNLRGATKLYNSSRAYLEKFGSAYLGFDIEAFWRQMELCFAGVLADPNPDRRVPLQEELIPTIVLSPAPAVWPDPAQFVSDDD